MHIYLVEYKNKIIGAYNNLITCQYFINGCMQNNLMTEQPKILTFIENTCVKLSNFTNQSVVSQVEPQVVSHVETKVLTEEEILLAQKVNEENLKKQEVMLKEKTEIQHHINMLKTKKKKLDESKVVYQNDINLFIKFREMKEKDEQFVIPELFVKKYELFIKLAEAEKLSWENFMAEYKEDSNYGDYFDTNEHDKKYENIEEEIEI